MILTVSDLNFSYVSGVKALDEISLNVEAGEVVGLIGPNGSGKSTLIKNIFDLVQLQSGVIQVEGFDHRTVEAKAHGLYLASNDFLPEFLTGWEYLRYVADMYGERVSRPVAEDLFRRYSMRGRLGDLIEDYSHGMKKKTQLVLSFLLRRTLTIIDETLNGIDLEALYLAEKEFDLMRAEGKSVVICSHDFSMLERLADRIIFLDQGHIVTDDSTRAILDFYGSLSEMVFGQLEVRER